MIKGQEVPVGLAGITFVSINLFDRLFGVTAVVAQVTDTDYLEQMRADISADRQALVAANLGLTDAEGQAFWPVYREYRNEMAAKVGDRLQNLIHDYADVLDTMTDDKAKAMVDEMMTIQQQEFKVRKSYLSKFRKALPEIKVARFLQIENQMDAIIKIGLVESVPLVASAD